MRRKMVNNMDLFIPALSLLFCLGIYYELHIDIVSLRIELSSIMAKQTKLDGWIRSKEERLIK